MNELIILAVCYTLLVICIAYFINLNTSCIKCSNIARFLHGYIFHYKPDDLMNNLEHFEKHYDTFRTLKVFNHHWNICNKELYNPYYSLRNILFKKAFFEDYINTLPVDPLLDDYKEKFNAKFISES